MAEDGFRGNVVIIGFGLLGTSLAMALKSKGVRVGGWTRREEVRNWAVENGVVDFTAAEASEVLSQADITVICLPIPYIIRFIQDHATHWKAGAIVTDVGSVKQVIVDAAETALQGTGVTFVGSHPMAGTEKSGPEHAFKELYDNSEVFVTRGAEAGQEAIQRVIGLWETIGAQVAVIDPAEHDSLVAYTSHIPHLLSLAMTGTVLDCNGDDGLKQLRYSGCATGFRDTSRITSSSPQMWREIIENNRDAVLEAAGKIEKKWKQLSELVAKGDFDQLEAEFARGKSLRDEWIKYKNETRNCGW